MTRLLWAKLTSSIKNWCTKVIAIYSKCIYNIIIMLLIMSMKCATFISCKHCCVKLYTRVLKEFKLVWCVIVIIELTRMCRASLLRLYKLILIIYFIMLIAEWGRCSICLIKSFLRLLFSTLCKLINFFSYVPSSYHIFDGSLYQTIRFLSVIIITET